MRSRYEGPGQATGTSSSGSLSPLYINGATQPRGPMVMSARSIRRGIVIVSALIIVAILQYVLYQSTFTESFVNIDVQSPIKLSGKSNVFSRTQTAAVMEKEWDHMVMVPGHSVIDIASMDPAHLEADSMWKLLDYQENQGLPEAIASHITTAVNLTATDSKSILIFSGGETRRDAGPISESLSYYIYAKQKRLLDGLEARVFTEEFSRDSFENLLFSMCRFKEITGYYPSRITIIGFDFKEARFTSLHRRAIHFPPDSFEYIAMVPTSPHFDRKRAEEGEALAFQAFQQNLYGCAPVSSSTASSKSLSKQPPGPLIQATSTSRLRGSDKANTEPASGELLQKRLSRNPYHRGMPYESSCPDIVELLRWCGPSLYPHTNKLPWTK